MRRALRTILPRIPYSATRRLPRKSMSERSLDA